MSEIEISNDENNTLNLPPNPGRVIEGLRDTGYTLNTALADIIDNSIAAEATKIEISIDLNPKDEVVIYVADNGIGMDETGLQNAMRYGSEQREDPSSLGKFGLGLKTSSTAFCRCLSVVSRGSGDDIVRKVQWDLDYVVQTNEWRLLRLIPSDDEIKKLDDVADGGTGTLVIWEKVDRLERAGDKSKNLRRILSKKIEDLRFHISMVYQRFLDKNDNRAKNTDITLNGTPIESWDPFCQSEEDTDILANENIEVDLPSGKTSSFTVKAYLLPNYFKFSTDMASKEARINNDMQGFYIYRENRLIHYGDWLSIYRNEPHYSLLRVEFSFDCTLDDAFSIDIKKSQILVKEEISGYLKDHFLSAPRRAASERYRIGERKQVGNTTEGAHASSNKNIEEKAPSVEEAKVTIIGEGEVEIKNRQGVFSHKIQIHHAMEPGQYRVIPVDTLDDGQLWCPCIVDERHAVKINRSHPYYQKIYFPVIQQGNMVIGMDALLWALAEAELSTFSDETQEQYEDMRIQVSRFVKKLISDLPGPIVEME